MRSTRLACYKIKKLLAGPGQPVDLCEDEASEDDLEDVDDGAGW
jgi:hypothetical protein